MCGIVGVVTAATNGFWQNEIEAFRDMLLMDTLRGWDSTGVFGVSNKNNVVIHKEASQGGIFIRSKEFQEFCRQAYGSGQIAVGHNRAATKGSIKDVNAHPFWVNDNTILVQNGTYRGEHKHLADVEVDSHAIAHIIEKYQDAVEEGLRHINAAYALVWYNVKQKRLYLIRNSERPLYITDTDRDTIMFASEAEFILAAASRNNISLKYEPWLIPPHTLVTITLDDDEAWKYEERELKNAEYDYKKGPFYNSQQHHKPESSTSIGEVKTEHPPFGQGHSTTMTFMGDPAIDAFPLRQNRSADAGFPLRSNTVQFNFFNILSRGSFDDYSVTKEIADKICNDWNSSRSKKYTIELEDYEKANITHDCRAFYVWGRLCTNENTIDSYVIFYTLVTGVTEDEVIDMVTKQVFYQTSNNTLIQNWTAKKQVIITANMISDFQPVMILDDNGKPIENVH